MAATKESELDSKFYKPADAFFPAYSNLGLTYDDVTLATLYSEVLPRDTQLETKVAESLHLNIPINSESTTGISAGPKNGGTKRGTASTPSSHGRTNVKDEKEFYIEALQAKLAEVESECDAAARGHDAAHAECVRLEARLAEADEQIVSLQAKVHLCAAYDRIEARLPEAEALLRDTVHETQYAVIPPGWVYRRDAFLGSKP